MGRVLVAAAVVSTLVALGGPAVHAATVTGVVQDSGGTPIDMVGVAFVDSTTQQEIDSTTTGADGIYNVTVPPATYDVHVQPPAASGFVPQTIPGRTITGDTTLDIVLVPAAVTVTLALSTPVPEAVEVTRPTSLPRTGLRIMSWAVPEAAAWDTVSVLGW